MSGRRWEIPLDRLWAMLEFERDIFAVLDSALAFGYVSDSVASVLGLSPDALIGQSLLSLVYPDDELNMEMVLRSLLETTERKATWVSFRCRHGDGTWRCLEARLHHREEAGEQLVLVIAADVTERRQLEFQLREAQRMEAVGRLAGGVAHDFNNVLTVILGNAELLLLDMPSDDHRRADVEDIRGAGERAKAVTQQLLAYSGRRTVDLRIVEPGELVVAARRMLNRLLGEDISIELDLTPDAGFVRVDPSQLEEVLINLAINARDAMPAGGVLTFQVCRADVRRPNEESVPYYVPPGDYCTIRVRDTGIGMDPDVLARVFEPFFTTKGPLKGTGLGLSTAYGIVKQSGGFIWARSTVGEGTVFHLLLKADDGPADPAPPARSSSLPAGSGRIFVVEDDAPVRRHFIRVLERGGFDVSGFGRPEEALGAFTAVAAKVDLLMTDVVMPGMSGPELAASCRAIRPGIPVLYLTGYTGDALRERGLPSATENILQKPVTPAQLLAAVGRYITPTG